MQEKPEKSGELVKSFRTRAGLTIEKTAGLADITERYLYRIENEGKIPSFEVACKLVEVLSIPGDSVFYPQKAVHDPDVEEITHMLYCYDKRSLKIVKAVLRAVLEDSQE